MIDKLTTAIEPFIACIVIAAGAELAGWLKFSNSGIVGVITVFCGILLVLNHVVKQISKPTKKG